MQADRNTGRTRARNQGDAGLPPYIVVGEWTDHTGLDRSSPYGLMAYATLVDGVAHVFPSGEAWRRHVAARAPAQASA